MPFEVEPSPLAPAARFGAPDEAQDASYLAASARMRSLRASLGSIDRNPSSAFVLTWVNCYGERSDEARGRALPLPDGRGRLAAASGVRVPPFDQRSTTERSRLFRHRRSLTPCPSPARERGSFTRPPPRSLPCHRRRGRNGG